MGSDGMHRFLGRVGVVGAVISGVVVMAAAAPAAAAVPCAVTAQRTSTPASDAGWDPVLSADGSVVVFLSDANIGGQNPGGENELWRRVGNTTTVLTDNDEDIDIERPDVSADGSRVVFATTADFTGTNPDHYETIWVWDLDEPVNARLSTLQVHEPGGAERPRISDDGIVVFQSEVDWDGENPDGNTEIFLRAPDTGAEQISINSADNDVKKPSISGDGNVVVYESDRDPFGQNADGNLELFRYQVDTGTTTQITNTVPDGSQESWMGNYLPKVDGDGSTVVFETEVPHGSLNADLQYQVMRWDNGTISEVTTDDAESYDASVSADGTRVVFTSDGNPVGRNADGNEEIFVHHGGTIRQITRTTGGENSGARIARGGNHIAFGSDRNLLGTNGDGSYEVFVATCGPVLKCDGKVVTVVVGQNNPTAGNDVIYGTAQNDTVDAGAGNDRFCGLGGNDSFTGGAGIDRFLGGNGADRGYGDAGADVLRGEAGADFLFGGTEPDLLFGGADNDNLNGGNGPGVDVCDGEAGNGDRASYCERVLQIP